MPDTPVGTTPPSPDLEFRMTRVEHDVGDLKAILGQILPMIVRIDATITATLPHLATKAEMQAGFAALDAKIGDLRTEVHSGDAALRTEMHSEFGKLRSELAEKPSKTYLWMVLGVLIMAYAAGLAGLAVLK
jgi:hypothetical protein